MKEEKKKKHTQMNHTEKKILSFGVDEKIMEDPEIDELLKESLIKESDELERELNEKPELVGVGASDDMFLSIVAKLKEQGIWEEDPEEELNREPENDSEENHENKVEADPEHHPEKEDAPRETESEEKPARVTEKEKADKADKNKEPETEAAGYRDDGQNETETSLDEIYAMLPEEDLRALKLGRQVEEKRLEKKRKRRKRKKVFRYSSVAAAVLVIVLGVGMTSEANRRLVLNMWDGFMANLGFRVATNYVEDENSTRSKTKEEIEAMKEIHEKLGITVIDFGYLPEGMEYQSCEIMEDGLEAVMFYEYNEKLFSVMMTNMIQEGSTYYSVDNETVLKKTVLNDQEIEAEIWETNLELTQETYIVKIEYEECRYILNGMLSFQEIEKITENAIIL